MRGEKDRATPREVFLGEARSRDVFPVLILHLLRKRPEYGNSLINGIRSMTAGVMRVSPNTIYPLLRRLEEKGYVEGKWERPDTRSRRFYTITPLGERKFEEMRERFEPHLMRVRKAVEALNEELYG